MSIDPKVWAKLRQFKEQELLVSGKVIEIVKYGSFIVDVEGVKGFVPSIDSFYLQTPKEKLLGHKLDFEITKVDEYGKSLVLSYSLPIKKRRINQLEIGQKITGKVCSIKPYGIFVDIHDFKGFLDKYEISSNRELKLNTIFEIGESIAVNVISIDKKRYWICLSIPKSRNN